MKATFFFNQSVRTIFLACLLIMAAGLLAQPSFQNRFLLPSADYGVSGVNVNANRYMTLQRLDVSTTNSDLLLTRLDAAGAVVQPSSSIGSPQQEFPRYLQKTFTASGVHDGYIIVGETTYGSTLAIRTDLFLIRTDTSGNVIWSRRYGKASSNEYGLCVYQMADRGFVAVGYSQSPGSISHAYILRTNASGLPLWNRLYNFGVSSQANYLDVRPNNAGTSGLYVTGSILPAGGNLDALLMHLNPATGDVIWANRYFHQANSNWKEIGKCVRVVRNNTEIAVTGTANTDIFTFKTNLFGVPIWGNRYITSAESLSPVGIIGADAAGNDLLIGGSMVTAAGDKLAFFQKISSTGVNLAFRVYQFNSPTITLNDVRSASGNGYMGVGNFNPAGNPADTYIFRTNNALSTPTGCPPSAIPISRVTGIVYTAASAQRDNMESFQFPVTRTTRTIQQNLCTGTALNPDEIEERTDMPLSENSGTEGIRIYPNPLPPNQAIITLLVTESPSGVPLSITVYDLAGKKMTEKTFPGSESGEFTLDAGGLPAGVFFIQISCKGNVLGTARLIRLQ